MTNALAGIHLVVSIKPAQIMIHQIEHVTCESPLIRKICTPPQSRSPQIIARESPTPNDFDVSPQKKSRRTGILHDGCKCFHPFLDTGGSAISIFHGILYLFLLGLTFGLVMPKNSDLPTTWYRYASSIVGYTYFVCCSFSFYPQIISNYTRKSTEGVSADYSVINFIGFFCYAIYTCALYWDEDIKQLYRERHNSKFGNDSKDAKITVQSNDVAFALHAFLFSGVWLYQLFIYGGLKNQMGRYPMSRTFMTINLLIVSSVSFYALMIWKGVGMIDGDPSYRRFLPYLNWLDFIYFLSFVKVFITLSKYIPQVILNARRKTCVGWNVWNVILDFGGATLCFVQLMGDAIDIQDFSSITGNLAKLGLSVISIAFDVSNCR